jgi:hypothetical protein
MKVSVSSKGYALSGISPTELNTVMFLLGTLKDRCFREQEADGSSYDGGDFVATLNKEELRALHRFVDGFWCEYEKMKEKINLNG